MSPLAKNDLQRIFRELDKNGDGVVSSEELNWLLERIGVDQFILEEIEWIVSKQSLNLDEFFMFYESISKKNDGHGDEGEVGDLFKAFQVFDADGDGFISSDELQSVLGRLGLWNETKCWDCSCMIRVYDTNLDGVLDFEEFKNMMLQA